MRLSWYANRGYRPQLGLLRAYGAGCVLFVCGQASVKIPAVLLASGPVLILDRNRYDGIIAMRRRTFLEVTTRFCAQLRCEDVLYVFLGTSFGSFGLFTFHTICHGCLFTDEQTRSSFGPARVC
jgi:hypothetical protein